MADSHEMLKTPVRPEFKIIGLPDGSTVEDFPDERMTLLQRQTLWVLLDSWPLTHSENVDPEGAQRRLGAALANCLFLATFEETAEFLEAAIVKGIPPNGGTVDLHDFYYTDPQIITNLLCCCEELLETRWLPVMYGEVDFDVDELDEDELVARLDEVQVEAFRGFVVFIGLWLSIHADEAWLLYMANKFIKGKCFDNRLLDVAVQFSHSTAFVEYLFFLMIVQLKSDRTARGERITEEEIEYLEDRRLDMEFNPFVSDEDADVIVEAVDKFVVIADEYNATLERVVPPPKPKPKRKKRRK